MMQLNPIGHGQALTAQILAANARPSMGPIRTVAAPQVRSQAYNLMDEVQKERAFNRDFYSQKDAQGAAIALEGQRQGNALALEGLRNENSLARQVISDKNAFARISQENEFRLGQLEKGNEYSLDQIDKQNENAQAMFGITKEHQLAMEGLRKSNNLEVQKEANMFQENMTEITQEFQVEREELGFEKAKQLYKQRRRNAMDDFRTQLEEKGQFDNAKRFWDSLADERKIDYQLTQEQKAFERRNALLKADREKNRENAILDASGTKRMAEQAFREYDDWVNQGGDLAWMRTMSENIRKAKPDIKDDELNSLVLSSYQREEARRKTNSKHFGEMNIAGGFDPNALAPGSTIKRPLSPADARRAFLRLQQIQAAKQGTP